VVYSPTGSGNVRVDQFLTNISVGFPNNGLVAENLFPPVRVRNQSDKYYIFGREAWLPSDSDYRAPGTVASEVPGLKVSTDTYYAQEHALQTPVADEERENVLPPMAPDRDATELITSRILIAREVAMKNLATTTTNYEAGMTVTLSGTSQWNDYVNSNPISDLKTGKRAIHAQLFVEPTVAIIPYQVMSQLEDHPDFIERIKYSERGILNSEIIAAVVGLPRVIVPGVGVASGNPGQTLSVGYLWGKDVVLAYVPPRAGLRIPAFAYEFLWSYPSAGDQEVTRWREEPRKSDLVRVGRRYDLKLVALGANSKSIAGYLIKTAVA
jgi:hypothetical protein